MRNQLVAGISFSNTVAQIAVLELRRRQVTVVHLEEYKRGKSGDLWFLERLLNDRKVFKKVSAVSVALDGSTVFQHSFPMDDSLTQREQKEHVLWELAHFIQDFNATGYINDVHLLQSHQEQRFSDVYVVSAQRSFIQQIQRALDEGKYELYLVDTNHFAGQYALHVNYPEAIGKRIVLASIGPQRMDVGALQDGKLISARYFVEASPEVLAKHLIEFCRLSGTMDIYLYGSGCTFAFMKTLQAAGNLMLTTMNPFRRLKIASSLRKSEIMIGQEHKYVASVGVALRKE